MFQVLHILAHTGGPRLFEYGHLSGCVAESQALRLGWFCSCVMVPSLRPPGVYLKVNKLSLLLMTARESTLHKKQREGARKS